MWSIHDGEHVNLPENHQCLEKKCINKKSGVFSNNDPHFKKTFSDIQNVKVRYNVWKII